MSNVFKYVPTSVPARLAEGTNWKVLGVTTKASTKAPPTHNERVVK
jgi:hypothetical protein